MKSSKGGSAKDLSLAQALDAASVRAWQWDAATGTVDWSPGLEELFGLAPGSFGRTFDAYLAVIPIEDRAEVLGAIRGALDGGGTHYDVEHRVIVGDGSVRWVGCRGQVLRDEAGKATGMAGIVWDITRRRAAELQAARLQRLSSVVGAVNKEIVRVTTREELFERACRIAVELGGFRLAWVGLLAPDGGRVLPAAVHGHDEGFVAALRIDLGSPEWGRGPTARAIRAGAPVVCADLSTDEGTTPGRAAAFQRGLRSSGAFPLRSKGHVVGALNIYASVVGGFGDEEVALLAGLADDMSFALDLLAREQERRFNAAVLEQMSEAVLACDPDARIKYWNTAAERLYGYTAEEAIGRDGTELLQTRWPNPEDVALHVEALRGGKTWRGEMIHKTKAGSELTVEASIGLLRDAKGVPVAGINVLQDVSARRRLEEQLRQAQKMEAVGVLAGGVAHDFNNLLGVMLGFAEIPLRSLAPGSSDAAALREVIAAAHRGAELTRQLLAFSRRQIIRLVPLDLNAVIREGAMLLSRVTREDVELVVRAADQPLTVRADAVQIEQILFNLCTNARQAMPGGGKVTIATRALMVDDAYLEHHPWARTGAFAELTVTDSGAGMDAATLARIFEPFFTTKGQGTGLGLSTVYGIVTQHGGLVHASSTVGVGTTLHVHLPLIEPVRASEAPRRADDAPPRGSETILIAEDAPPLRALVTLTLESLGYRVIAAEDGLRAVEEFERRPRDIDLVVLDVVMPRLGALAAYQRMRAIRPDVKVLFTTGYAPETTQLAELLEGARLKILEKPFTSHALGVSVRGAIDA